MPVDSRAIATEPKLPDAARALIQRFEDGLLQCRCQNSCASDVLKEILESPDLQMLSEEDRLPTQLFFELVDDLTNQGWCFEYSGDRLIALPPSYTQAKGADQSEIKRRLRTSLEAARNEQLSEESTHRFVLDMERPRWHRGQQVNVLSLTVSAQQLSRDLASRLDAPEPLRQQLLREAIKPYLQLVSEGRDQHTGLRLVDIWRYFRYTWSLPLSAQPGRQMLYLVRDASREHHPIVGIGALGSSIVQITRRDKLIGWYFRELERVGDLPGKIGALGSLATLEQWLVALREEVNKSIDEVFWGDLLTEDEVANPDSASILGLAKIAQEGTPVNQKAERSRSVDIVSDTFSPMYRRKRATELHRLLRAKATFLEAERSSRNEREQMEWLLSSEDGLRVVRTALRNIKKRHVGSSMMDITTCGAIPPYSELLAGKLVALLMASPQVISDYQSRYSTAPSEIASRMKGHVVIRPARLALLGTTSLYFIGSSQYNRLHCPTALGEIRYIEVGPTEGYGTVHLSHRTYRTVQALLRSHPDLAPESNEFAAGVNYKLRSVSSALGYLGLGRLQEHKTPRLVYLVPLALNWREYLTGHACEPISLFNGLDEPQIETEQIIEYWKERWFIPRVRRAETVGRLREAVGAIRVSDYVRNTQPASVERPWLTQERLPLLSAETGGDDMPTQSSLSWRAFAELKDLRTSLAERLTLEELRAVHISTKLDQGLMDIIRSGRRVYLTGSPGDGKTHIIRRHMPELLTLEAIVSLDASADDEATLVGKIRSAIDEHKPAVIAINEGPLRRLLRLLPNEEQRQIKTQIDRPYLYDAAGIEDFEAVVVNLGLRQVLAQSVLDGALQLLLNRVDFTGAPARIKENWQAISRPRVQERLALLLRLVAQSGGHVTMNQLLGFLSHIVTAGKTTPERAADIRAYHDLAFDDDNPLSEWLKELDPAAITHPIVDMWLWDGSHVGDIAWLDAPPGPPPVGRRDQRMAVSHFHSLKRKFFFEALNGGSILEMLPDDRRQFHALLADTSTARDTAKKRVLEVLSHFFGNGSLGAMDEKVHVWTGLRYEATDPPTAFISTQTVDYGNVELQEPRLRPAVEGLLEYEPSHIRLNFRPRSGAAKVGLDVDLDLWLALMKLERGTPQRHHDPVIGRRLHQLMSRLAASCGDTPGGYVTAYVRDAESSETRRIEVSLEKRRYLS